VWRFRHAQARQTLAREDCAPSSRKIARSAVAELDDDYSEVDALGELAGEVLIDLYHALSGHSPKAVRVYGEDDALLLLLRFNPAELVGSSEISVEPLIDTTFIALPSMIASAVQRRAGRTLYPGNLSVCADRGLAVFAFSALEEAAATTHSDTAVFIASRPSWSEDAVSQLVGQPAGLL
jgi:hypothetical protein